MGYQREPIPAGGEGRLGPDASSSDLGSRTPFTIDGHHGAWAGGGRGCAPAGTRSTPRRRRRRRPPPRRPSTRKVQVRALPDASRPSGGTTTNASAATADPVAPRRPARTAPASPAWWRPGPRPTHRPAGARRHSTSRPDGPGSRAGGPCGPGDGRRATIPAARAGRPASRASARQPWAMGGARPGPAARGAGGPAARPTCRSGTAGRAGPRQRSGLPVEHGHRRLVADPPAGVDQAPDQVDVLADPQARGRTADRVQRGPADHQGGGRHVADAPGRARPRPRRARGRGASGRAGTGRWTRSAPGPAAARRADPGCHRADGGVGEQPGEVVSQPGRARCSRCRRRPPGRWPTAASAVVAGGRRDRR